MEVPVFELYPRHSHRTPAQIAEDAGGSFEPRAANREKRGSDVERTPSGNAAGGGDGHASATLRPGDQPNR